MAYRDDFNRRLQVSTLHAKRELLEIEREVLLREITSPQTPQDRKSEALMRRLVLADRCAEVTEQLKTLESAAIES